MTTDTLPEDAIYVAQDGTVLSVKEWTSEAGSEQPALSIERVSEDSFVLEVWRPEGIESREGTLSDVLLALSPSVRSHFVHLFEMKHPDPTAGSLSSHGFAKHHVIHP